jgi:hypothetical protein
MAQSPKPDQTGLSPLVKGLTDELRDFREERKNVERARWWREWFTLVLLICTTLGVFWQISEMIRVYDPIAEQSKGMMRQASAMEDIFNANKEQQRAIFATPNVMVLPVREDKTIVRYAFFPQFTNIGSTRTSTFNAWASIRYFDGPIPQNMDFNKPPQDIGDQASSVIVPGNSSFQLSPISITEDQVQKAVKKDGTMLLWGEFDYSDIYEPQRIKTSHFCVVINPITPNIAPQANQGKDAPPSDQVSKAPPASNETQFTPTPYRADCNTRTN